MLTRLKFLLGFTEMKEEEASAGVQDQATKMKASEFHLSWNNYEASLASFLRLLSSAKEGEEALSDVTISCSGGKLFQVSHPHQSLSHVSSLLISGSPSRARHLLHLFPVSVCGAAQSRARVLRPSDCLHPRPERQRDGAPPGLHVPGRDHGPAPGPPPAH